MIGSEVVDRDEDSLGLALLVLQLSLDVDSENSTLGRLDIVRLQRY